MDANSQTTQLEVAAQSAQHSSGLSQLVHLNALNVHLRQPPSGERQRMPASELEDSTKTADKRARTGGRFFVVGRFPYDVSL